MLKVLFEAVKAQTQFFPRALLMTLLLATGWILTQKGSEGRRQGLKSLAEHWRVLPFVFYLSFLLVSTVFSRSTIWPYRNVLTHFGFRGVLSWDSMIIENTLFFVPYTPLFLWAFRPKKPWRAAFLVSLATTCVIEFSQLLLWLGDFQLSDLFHNTLGGMIGCGLWQLAVYAVGKRKKAS